jgi:Cft2 family RNA processing exonuclease
MRYVSLGDTDAIGASCHYIDIEGTGLVVDAGMHPEEEGENSLPRFDFIHGHAGRHVDHAFVTHAHHDHIGALPVLVREFPHAQVHMTPATRQLADVVLPASAKLQRRKQREGSTSAAPLYSPEEVETISFVYQAQPLEQPFDVTGVRGEVPVEASFFDAGHVLGAAGMLLEWEPEGEARRRAFYTSDTNVRPQTILPGGSYPEEPVDVLFLESTMGADDQAELTTRRTEEKRFAEALRETLVDKKGAVLIPSFALGRAQEIIALIGRYKDRGIIPDVPVYTAGSMRAFADLYDKTRYSTPRLNPDFEVYGVQQKRVPRSDARLLENLNEPSIHVVASGMLFERTLSNRVAQLLVGHEKNAILFVGYARPDSPADLLRRAAEEGPGTEVVLDKSAGTQKVYATVDRFRFSGHSHRRDLLTIVEKLKPKQIVLIHGETSAREWMRDNILYFYPEITVHAPELGQELTISFER